MNDFRVLTDVDECRRTWQRAFPADRITDLWDVRDCFHQHFGNRPHFLVSETADGVTDLLPLCWIEEFGYYGYFPGETWQGKTWLEQNRIIATEEGVVDDLLGRSTAARHLRYLLPMENAPDGRPAIDETGYLFRPPPYDFDVENYFQEFSRRSAKRLRREIAALEDRGLRYRLDDASDFDILVRFSLERFGSLSYFDDPRFRGSFRSLLHFLREREWLRLTTVIIGDEIAAVDMGCLYRGVYTLLAGGTNRDFPGVAKVINLHHIRRACRERLQSVDFLCGDFSWKKLFHLTPRPLYLLSNAAAKAHEPSCSRSRSAACVE